ncbi:lactonase family protein [Nostoc commune]|uniref:lactonase family protein n=1 Tax=Nostoc commune TaxID=1178 RepID=UPI002073453D|nr:lactonase family protein [Nostoc commune]
MNRYLFNRGNLKIYAVLLLSCRCSPTQRQVGAAHRRSKGAIAHNILVASVTRVVTVSLNGKFLYAAEYDDLAIVVFARDAQTGKLK